MNSSEEKQIFLLGRIIKRDPNRVENLLRQDKLMAPKVAIDFSQKLLQQKLIKYDNTSIKKVFSENYIDDSNAIDYRRVMNILSHD